MTDVEQELAKVRDAFEKHGYDDLKHFAELREILDRLEEGQKAQGLILEPLGNTYKTVNTLGKWLMPFLVAASLIIGIVWGILKILAFRP